MTIWSSASSTVCAPCPLRGSGSLRQHRNAAANGASLAHGGGGFSASASRSELPLAVVEPDDHAGAFVHAVEAAGLEVVDAVCAHHFLRADDGVAQRHAELGRAR